MGKQDLIKSVKEAKANSKERKFKESLELAINLKDVDLTDPKNRINDEVQLPSGRGKPISIAVIGSEELKSRVKDKSDRVYGAEDLSTFAEKKKDFKKIAEQTDFMVAEVTLMATVGKSLGQVLGPRGKMPKPVPPGQDPTTLINNLRRTVRIRTRDKKTFHVPVGTKDMKDEDIAANITAVIKRIIGKLDKGSSNIASVYLKTTMGKPVKVNVGDVE
ncbi:MAG: 50S ribosomal protein L1 [Candidatus Thermoplasmatota archaeon]|nr:50S ribosomal protein L1 [Candidatus Thermoplasmatota archaeon]